MYIGDYTEDETIYTMFNTYTSDDPSASCTITNFVNTDVHIHKDDGTTQRNNAAGITVSTNFDGITGSHMIKIDTNNNTVAGFWVKGHDYFVRIEGTTVDAATVNAMVCHFSIENRFVRGTNSAALATNALTNATWTDAKAVHLDANISSRNATTPPTVTQIKTKVEEAGSTLATILTDTNELQDDWKNGGRLDHILDLINADAYELSSNQYDWLTATGFSTHSAADVKTAIEVAGSKLATILTDTNEIQTDLADGGRLDLLFDRMLDVMEIKHSLSVNDLGGTATTTKFITTLTEDAGFPWERAAVLFTSGANNGLMRRIKAYNGTTKEITIQTPVASAPANGDTFVMPAVRAFITPDIEDIADQVCEELLTDHPGVGSLAKGISDILTDTDDLQTNQGAWATAVGFATENPPSQVLADYKATGFNTVVPDAAGVVPTASEIKTEMEGVGTKLTAVKDKTDNLPIDPADQSLLEALLTPMQTDLDSLTDEIGGKWEIVSNQMIFYKSDNTTEIMRFNLFDAAGNPAIADVVKRERV